MFAWSEGSRMSTVEVAFLCSRFSDDDGLLWKAMEKLLSLLPMFSTWTDGRCSAGDDSCLPPFVQMIHACLHLCSLRIHNALVETCFKDCVDTFWRKMLDKQEESCVRRYAEKFLKHSMRVGMRFADTFRRKTLDKQYYILGSHDVLKMYRNWFRPKLACGVMYCNVNGQIFFLEWINCFGLAQAILKNYF